MNLKTIPLLKQYQRNLALKDSMLYPYLFLYQYVVLCLLSGITLSCHPHGESFPADNRCGAPGVRVYPATGWDSFFGTAEQPLAAGNITGHIAGTDSKTYWLVNDARVNTLQGAVFVHNCLLVTDAQGTAQVHYSPLTQQGLLPDPSADRWYTLDQGIEWEGKLELIVSLWQKTGTGDYDYKPVQTAVVRINPQDISLESVRIVPTAENTRLGAALYRDGQYTYAYATQARGFSKDALLARIPTGSLAQSWSYYNGYGWVSDPNLATPVLSNVSDYFSVFSHEGTLYLLTQPSLAGAEVTLYRAFEPQGTWDFHHILYCRPPKDSLIATNTVVYQLADQGNTLRCTYSLADRNLQTKTPAAPQFIDIDNWR
jgi:hypothetical protein